MNADREAQEFLANQKKMEELGAAISTLREIGFERVLRRLGEPMSLPSQHPHYNQMAASQYAENIGWFKALDMMFNFADVVGGIAAEGTPEPDYGGRNLAQERMGYSEEELRGL